MQVAWPRAQCTTREPYQPIPVRGFPSCKSSHSLQHVSTPSLQFVTFSLL